jgi:hypothetical protein
VETLCAAAGEAQYVKASGKRVFSKPSAELISRLAVDRATMQLSTAFDVVDRKKPDI